MRRVITLAAMAALGLALAACSEKPQTVSAAKKSHTPAYEGTSDGFSVGGWKAGDKESWLDQIHTRNRAQNEYNRMPPAAPAK